MINLSFAGCGFLGVYHLGVAACLTTHAPKFLKSITAFAGASAGSLIAAVLATDTSLDRCGDYILEMTNEARKHPLGPFNPQFDLVQTLERGLKLHLPDNAHKLASGKLFVSVTKVKERKNVIISDYNSREELIKVLLASCYIPFYAGFSFPEIKGHQWFDGGFTDNLPVLAFGETIRVSPFSGKVEISPRDRPQAFLEARWRNMHVYVNAENMRRARHILYPPPPEVQRQISLVGYQDAMRFIRTRKLS